MGKFVQLVGHQAIKPWYQIMKVIKPNNIGRKFIHKNDILIINYKNVVSVGFEPTRIAPVQLECTALTTRPKHQIEYYDLFINILRAKID